MFRLTFPSKLAAAVDKPMVWLTQLVSGTNTKDDGKEVSTSYGFDITKTKGNPESKGSDEPFPYDLRDTWALIVSMRSDLEQKWNHPEPRIFTFNVGKK